MSQPPGEDGGLSEDRKQPRGAGVQDSPPSLYLTTSIRDRDAFIVMLTVLSTFQGMVQGH